jgi:high affinity Mn2+ porin
MTDLLGGRFLGRSASCLQRIFGFPGQTVVLAVITAVIVRPGLAAELSTPLSTNAAADAKFNWTGWYFGGHVGLGFGHVDAVLRDPIATTSNNKFGGQFGGVQLGYNKLLPSRVLVGFETDISFPNSYPSDAEVWTATSPRGDAVETFDYAGTVRGRLGYAPGHWLFYLTGGFAWSSSHVLLAPANTDVEFSRPALRTGWTAGAGIEVGFDHDWTVRLEYLHSRFGDIDVVFPTGASYSSKTDLSLLRLALNRKFDWLHLDRTGAGTIEKRVAADCVDWEIHGQTTYIHQGYPSFRALYTGANSLTPGAQAKETWTSSAFLTARLWQGGEFYYNPELFQGFGLSDTTGLGGFSNGEAQKSNFLYPHYNTSRLFLRQSFGLGGEQETVESDYGQMSGKRDVSRLTVQVGKFAVHDVFDNNAYAQDSRADFLNWSLWAAGAFDYAADKVGLTYGAVVDLNQPAWALRTGYFLIGDKPNSNNFDTALFKRGEYVAELEMRYALASRPGKFRVIGFVNSSFAGDYRDAVNLALAIPGLDTTDAIVQTRKGRIKYGYVFNLEQSIRDDLGLFARWSWNDGRNEISAFTDIDASLSGGVSIKGATWGRPDDVIGIAGVVNGLSRDHRDYLAAGGLGVLVGDGALNYQTERIAEMYYAWRLAPATTLTFDYQFVDNPAYNADRGPVSIFSGRLHASF